MNFLKITLPSNLAQLLGNVIEANGFIEIDSQLIENFALRFIDKVKA
jgi:hypothetical protein